MAWSHDNSSGGDARLEFELCTGLARLHEFRLALFGGCAKASSECTTTAQLLRRRHECRCTGEQRDCGENTHVADVASVLSQQCGRLSWLQPCTRVGLACQYARSTSSFSVRLVHSHSYTIVHSHSYTTIIHDSAKTSARTLSTMAVRCHASRFTRNAGASPGATHDTCVTLQEAPRGSIK